MPRRTRSKILGKRWQYEQRQRERDLRALLHMLRSAWRRGADPLAEDSADEADRSADA